MALKISRQDREFTPKWRDNRDLPVNEQISVKFKTLRIADMFEVQRDTNVNLMGGFEIDQDDPDSITRYWGLVQEVLKKYVFHWKGVIVDDVEITDSEGVLSSLATGHMELLGEIFSNILSSSSGTEEEEKNSEPESEQPVADSGGHVKDVSVAVLEKSAIVAESSPTIQEAEIVTT